MQKKKTEKLNVVLFGPPGAGKGTQAKSLLTEYDLLHISTGDILRMEIADETALGIEAKKVIENGQLVPDNIVIGMIGALLEKNTDANGFIFDGFPRTRVQAEALDKLMEEMGWNINILITLDVPDNEVVKRILIRGKNSGRADDQNIDVIENRLKVYHEITSPVIEYYKAQKKYRSINGTGAVDEVFERICDVIDEY
ncbi:MAG: adenylate kinase [Bacteroidetes bacterium GWF2_38_335]|nr:MAG: adenylate kinase [Bacteroidetes bacterium GWF2_38_335]OFY80260.1 MAG: adenylate kinase [Bacteroidetes bacterium RIFOXYA12_FULL_38_20]